jgi:hypothetical protein
MSAAEPAIPERPYLNTTTPAHVVSIDKHRGRAARTAAKGRWSKVNTPHEPGHSEVPGSGSLESFADSIETSFNEIEQSLTNPATAAAFLRTLDVWERALQGSEATGIISAEQLAELTEVIRGMRQAPRLV